MATVTDALVVQLSADIRGLQASLSDAQGSVRRFKENVDSDVKGLTNSLGPLRNAFIGVVTAIASFQMGRAIVDAGMQMQALQNRMIAATGDIKVAADAMEFARSTANRLGLDFRATADGFAGFSAATLRAGLTLQQTKDIFTGVSEAAAALHLSSERVGLVFTALSQMANKGKVSMEELSQQLGDSLPGALAIFSKAMGVSTAEFTKMISQGQVLVPDLIKLGTELHNQFGDRAVAAASSAQAAFALFENAVFDLKVQLANGGFLDAVTDATRKLTSAMSSPETQEGLRNFAVLLGDIANAAVKAAVAMGDLWSWIDKKIEGGGDTLFGVLFGQEGVDALHRARAGKTSQKPASVNPQEASGLMVGFPGEPISGNETYTMGKVSPPNSSGSRDGIVRRVEGVEKYFGDETDRLRIQYEQNQKILEDALKKGAITRKRYNDDVLQLQQDFAKRMDKFITKEYGDEVEKENDLYADKKKALDKLLDTKVITQNKYYKLAEKLEKEHQERIIKAENEANRARRSNMQQALDGFLGIQSQYQQKTAEEQGASFRESLSQAAQHNKTAFELEKAAKIASALLSARQSVVDAYAWGTKLGGPALGAVFAGVAAAAQAANIASIASTSFGGTGANVSEGGSSGAVSGTTPDGATAGSTTPVRKELFLNTQGRNIFTRSEIKSIADQLNEFMGDGYSFQIA